MEGIPEVLMNPIMDFLTARRMYVKYNRGKSPTGNLNVGCVQGSVLGPKLFALYCKDLIVKLPSDVHITAYADDSYVTVFDDTMDGLKLKIEQVLDTHEQYLESIGMVVNKAKTELIVFDKKDPPILELRNGIKSRKNIKALGIHLSSNLDWSEHVTHILSKTSHIINKVKFLRRWIDQDTALKLITSQYFGIVYYAAPVWLTPQLSAVSWQRLNSSHYRALRAVVGDYKRKLPRAVLNIITKRATPRQWSNYAACSLAIKLFNGQDTRIGDEMRKQCYINDRQPRKGTFFDTSKYKVGRHNFVNRLNAFSNLDFDWIGEHSKDYIRRNLKRQFITF